MTPLTVSAPFGLSLVVANVLDMLTYKAIVRGTSNSSNKIAKRAIIISFTLTATWILLAVTNFFIIDLDMETKIIVALVLTTSTLRNPIMVVLCFEVNHINKMQTTEERRQEVIDEARKRREDCQPA